MTSLLRSLTPHQLDLLVAGQPDQESLQMIAEAQGELSRWSIPVTQLLTQYRIRTRGIPGAGSSTSETKKTVIVQSVFPGSILAAPWILRQKSQFLLSKGLPFHIRLGLYCEEEEDEEWIWMEDVVLHCPPQSADGLSSLLEWTEKLLEPFPCRSPPLFRPWFTDSRLPIRPARPPPVIPAAEEDFSATQNSTENTSENGHADGTSAENHQSPQPQWSKDTLRSWSVVPQRELLPRSHLLSKQFDSMVSIHKLHLRQRAKWVITKRNCGNVEKVWRGLNQSIQSSRLPTCNANIQKERAEIWVFCDVLYAEQVGRLLKEELQLSGRILLSVHRLANIFSM
ncbi:hypothetical protein OJAV_G00094710 [Oryzias javanicus]|uniref:Uncharacterized protein n=1 Tax=Oryzias javanicus TaxID=123683 RepID=A0A3S2Q3A4_ORYJA|nr:hypothetical protein OJAV_G00094710 [Oryzias javanicus]